MKRKAPPTTASRENQKEAITGQQKDESVTPSYGSKEYWDNRYMQKHEDEAGHEWYFTAEELMPLIHVALGIDDDEEDKNNNNNKHRILEIGCGDMPLGPALVTNKDVSKSVEQVICLDYSETVITDLQAQYINDKKLEFVARDATDLNNYFTENHFDLIVDKGTLDAVLSDQEKGKATSIKIISEAARVCAVGGTIMIVSHLNANTGKGMKWLEDVVMPALLSLNNNTVEEVEEEKEESQWFCYWDIEVHGSAAAAPENYSLDDDANSHVEVEDDDDDGDELEEFLDNHVDNDDDQEGTEVQQEEEANFNDANSNEAEATPAVYLIRKRGEKNDEDEPITLSFVDY